MTDIIERERPEAATGPGAATGPDALTGPNAVGPAAGTVDASTRRAVLYRMATDAHLCPFGLKARSMLNRHGFDVDDRLLTTRAEQDAFKAAHDVSTTPQIFIGGERVGGYTDLKAHLGYRVRGKEETTYTPVIAIFAVTALMALAVQWRFYPGLDLAAFVQWFVASSMCALAIQKLRDVGGFVNGFLGYDLLARRYVPYGYVYPFAEGWVGIGMIALIGTASPLVWLVAPVGLVIGTIGAVSVVKAVYLDKRDLKCACVGGSSNVPLGFVSLTENVMMAAMGVWMLGTWMLASAL